MKFDRIQNIWVVLKIWLKNEIFNHSESANMKLHKIQNIWVVLKIWLKNWVFWPPHSWEGWNLAKFRSFQSGQKIWFKIEIFWPLWTWEGWNLTRYRYFESSWKFGSEMRFSTTLDLQRMKFGKIQEFSVTLKIWFTRNWGSCPACPCYFKDERGILSMPGLN